MHSQSGDILLSASSTEHGQPAEAYGGPELPASDSIYECLKRGLVINPDKVAFISMHQGSNHLADTVSSVGPADVDCLHWTYRQLNEASLKLATYLLQHPLRQRRLACLVWNSIEQAILYWAVAHMRGVFIPLDPTLLEPGREESIDGYLSTLQPDIVVASSYDDRLENVLSATAPETIRISITHADTLPGLWRSFSSVLRGMTIVSPIGTITHDSPPDPYAAVQILCTSGTTANPKLIAHSAAKVTPFITYLSQAIPPSMVIMATTANFRTMYMMYMLVVHQAGATLVTPNPYFVSATTVVAILKYRPQIMGTVTAQIRAITAEASRTGATFSSLRSVAVSGDVITSDMLSLIRNTCPNAAIRTVYSLTETFPLTRWPSLPDPFPSLANDVVSAGKPTPSVTLRVCAQGTFNPLQRGETGELWVAGQGLLDSYIDGRDPHLFRTASDLKGNEKQWFCTGDSAMLDKDDYLYVLGRYKDIIVRAGINLSPVAIEAAMQKLGCPDAHVVGIPDELLGSVPAAVVRTLDGKRARHVADEVVRMLGKEHRLENIWTLQDLGLDDWIYNSSGKVSKTDLQKTLRQTVLRERL